MSSSLPPRVKRGKGPKGKLKSWNYRKRALPFLLTDFESRCGYSMRHVMHSGSTCMEVDHFNSQAKASCVNNYSNLILAFRNCNNKKGAHWPTAKMKRDGIYFIDPTKERDYDFQIFEDPATGKLVPTTRAARYQIDMLDLNDPSFIQERKDRSDLRALLEQNIAQSLAGSFSEIGNVVRSLRELIDRSIPPISAPPPHR